MLKRGIWKLVRDAVPKLYECNEGRRAKVRIVTGRERQKALVRKMVEESRELAAVLREGLIPDEERMRIIEEMADYREAERAFCRQYGISLPEVYAAQCKKRKDRGGFERGIMMFCD